MRSKTARFFNRLFPTRAYRKEDWYPQPPTQFLVFMCLKKLKLKILSFYCCRVKVIFKHVSVTCLELGRLLCFELEHGFSQCVASALFLDNMLRA